MSRRTDIVTQLQIDLSSIAESVSRLRTFNEVNIWPYITFTASSERRTHIGANIRWADTSIMLRGYTYDASIDSMIAAEDLARQIETIVDNFRAAHPELNVVQMKVLSIRTDEGVMSPYSILDMTIALTYEVN